MQNSGGTVHKELGTRKEIRAKIGCLYPAGDRKFNGARMAEARLLIESMRKDGKGGQKKLLAEELAGITMRAARDAIETNMRRKDRVGEMRTAKSLGYFADVRAAGTKEEKDLCLRCVTDVLGDELKKPPSKLRWRMVLRACDALYFLWDFRAVDVLRKAGERLRACFIGNANKIEEMADFMEDAARFWKRAPGPEAIMAVKPLGDGEDSR